MRLALAPRMLLALALAALPFGCRVFEPSNRPLDACRSSCAEKAGRECSAAECERGCELILDRIIEGESERVIACVAEGARRCTDVVWAQCASRVGPHADGGPPAPPPPPEHFDDED